MADQFTAKFKVDVSDLKKGISEATKSIKEANAAFKAQTAGMDKWSKDADGLSAKLKQLSTNLKNQKTILSSYEQQLRKQEEGYAENGKRIEQLKDKLQQLASQGIAKTDAEYQKYEKALKSVVKEQQNNANAIDDLKIKILDEKAAIGQTEAAVKKYSTAQKELETSAKSLKTKISDQEKQLSQLKSKYAEVATSQNKNSSSAKELSSQIEKLSTDLKKNKLKMSEAEAAADKYDRTIDNLGDDAEKTGKKMDGLGEKIAKGLVAGLAAISTAAVAAGKSLWNMANEVAETGNDIDKQSQKLGISAENYQKLSYAMEVCGADVEDFKRGTVNITKELANFQNGVEGAGESFDKLDVSLTNTDGTFRTTEDVLLDCIDALADMDDETQRNALANEIFGKSYQELKPLLNSGSEGIRKLMEEAEEYGMVMSDDAVKASAAFEDSLTKLKGTLTGVKNSMISQILPSLSTMIDGFSGLVLGVDGSSEKIKEGMRGVIDTVNQLVPVIVEFVTSIGQSVLEAAPSIIESLAEGLMKAIPNLMPTLTNLATQLADMFISLAPSLLQMGVEVILAIIDGISSAIPMLVSKAAEIVPKIVDTLIKAIPQLLQGAITFFSAIVQAIPVVITNLVNEIPKLIKALIETLVSNIPKVIEGAGKLLHGIVQAIPTTVVEIVKSIPKIIQAIVEGLLKGIGSIISAAGKLFFGIVDKSAEAAEAIKEQSEAIYDMRDALKDTSPELADYNRLLSSQGNSISDLDSKISETENAITDVLKAALQEQRELRDEDIVSIEQYMEDLNRLQEEKLQIYRSQQISELKKLQLETGMITQESAAQHLANTEAALEAANQATEDAYTARLTTIEQKYMAMNDIGSAAYQAELENAKAAHDEQIAENESYYANALSLLGEKSTEWVQADADKWDQIANNMSEFNNQTESDFDNFMTNAADWLHLFDETKEGYVNALSEMDLASANGFLNMIASVQNHGGEIPEEAKQIAADMLGSFDNLPDSLDEAGKDALLGMIYGMEDEIPGLQDTSQMSADEIVDTIKEALGIHSPSTVMEEVGENAIEGLINGLNKQQPDLDKISITLSKSIAKVFTDNGKVMMQVGSEIVLSISKGFDMSMSKVTDLVKLLIRNIQTIFQDNHGNFENLGTMIIKAIYTMIRAGQPELEEVSGSVTRSMLSVIKSYISDFIDSGAQMAYGVANGFLSQEGYVRGQIAGMMSRLVSSVRSQMKISSPSKVFEQIGDYMAQGLGIGFVDEMKTVTRNIQNSMPTKLANSLLNQMNGSTGSAAFAGNTTNNSTMNFTQIINAPKQPSRIELYRQTKNLLAMAEGGLI